MSLAIRPYLNPNDDNMGLSRAGQVLFGKSHNESLTCIYRNGRPRYITGLDEFAASVDQITDPDERDARKQEIRKIVAELEPRMGGDQVKVDDEEFWNKVKMLHPTNVEFWSKFEVSCSNDPIYLDPVNNPWDLLMQYAIEAGGFTLVAPSLEAAQQSNDEYKFFLDKMERTVSLTTGNKKIRNQAGALLEKLYEKDHNRLLYVAKVIDPNSTQYKKSTSTDILYDVLDRYLSGELEGFGNKRENSLNFIKLATSATTEIDTLKLRALIKDATFHRLFTIRPDGQIYDVQSQTPMGRKPEEVLKFLQSPLNDNIYTSLVSRVEKHW